MPRMPIPFAPQRPPSAFNRAEAIEAATAAFADGDAALAHRMLLPLLRQDASDPALLHLAGLIHRALGDRHGAIRLLERAIALRPGAIASRIALAETLVEVHRAPDALAALDVLPAKARGEMSALLARAAALGQIGDEQGEIDTLKRLVAREPRDIPLRLQLGHALRAIGKTDDAIAQYRSILEMRSASGAAWWSIANLKSALFDDADRAAMADLLGDPALPEFDRIHLSFAMGRAEELAGRDEAAFGHYAAGNALRHAKATTDPAALDERLTRSEALLTADFFADRPDHGSQSTAPIFIVGMQRSGSTLLEQMLATHPDIEATAELPHINQLLKEVDRGARQAGRTLEQQLAQLNVSQTRALGDEYLRRAAAHRRTDRPHFIDKMPNNWAHLGFIRLILPKAAVIDVRRDPMACGWSNFRQLYASGLEHSYSLDAWAHFYRAYLANVATIERAVPDWIQRVIYERLVADPEAELRRLCEALDLAFEPAMLDFHDSGRTVRTISAEQVRRPLNRDAIEHWQRFDAWLGPLRDALGPALSTWKD